MAPRNKRRASTSTNVRHGLKSPKKARHEERDENAATDDDANIDIWTVPSEEYSSSESGTDYEDDDKADRTVTGKSSDISDCIDSNRKPKVDKAAMAFPKGTYVIRLTDVTNNDCKWIWRIDNHQLIHKYVLEDNDVISQQMTSSKRRYVKSFRYSGWFCNEEWNFVELNVLNREEKEDHVEVDFPTASALEGAKRIALEENRKRQIISNSG